MRALILISCLLAACGSRKAAQHDAAPPPAAPLTDGVDQTTADTGAFTVALQWLIGPAWRTESSCRLIFAAAAGQPVASVAGVALRPFMPSMGHPGDVADLQLAADPEHANVVLASGFKLRMPGPWELEIAATVNGRSGTAKVPVDVPK
jgi:hypothetical protein